MVGEGGKAVGGPLGHLTAELVRVPATLEAEVLEQGEGGGLGQAVDVHQARGLNDVVGVVALVDGYTHLGGGAGQLADGVDNETVVFLAVVAGDDIQAVADAEQGGHIGLVHK